MSGQREEGEKNTVPYLFWSAFTLEVKRWAGESCSDPDAESCWRSLGPQQIEDCFFKIPISRPGRYRLLLTSNHYQPYQESFELDEDLDLDLGVIRPEPGLDLEVTVSTRRGKPLAGAVVLLEGLAPARLTDRQGRVRFSSLSEAQSVVAVHASHAEHAPIRTEIEIPDSRAVQVELPEPGEIFGRVLKNNGTPATGETISAYGSDKKQRFARVAHDGRYRFERLAPGRWQIVRNLIQATSTSARRSGGDSKIVELGEGEVLEVSFFPLLQLHGRITLNGQPLAGQTVSVISQGGDHTFAAVQLISDADGRYSVAVPGPGTWRFRHRGASADADVLGPCPCLVDIDLARNNEQ